MNEKFKVIKIINDTSLIVNAGSNNEIEVGDVMEICGKGENIYDPETNEKLGQLDVVKARLNVSEVYEKMCVCETSYVSTYFSTLLSNPLFNSTQKKLNVEPTEITGEGEKIIRIGDIAKHIKQKKQDENKADEKLKNMIK